jgi:hypothetical protein
MAAFGCGWSEILETNLDTFCRLSCGRVEDYHPMRGSWVVQAVAYRDR